MASIGSMEAFSPEKESIECYVERLEQYLLANEIDDADIRKATLLTVLGATVYAVLRNLLSPNPPSTKTYDELVETLKAYYSPKPLVIGERYRFWKRDQEPGETVATYIVVMRKLASTCSFGLFLDEALRDRIVCGLRNDVCRRRLLCEDRLTLKRTIDMAHAMELAEKNSMELSGHGGRSATAVNKVFTHKKPNKQTGSKEKECWRCGGKHAPKTCRYKAFKCHNCSKVGHLAKKCNSSNPGNKSGSTHQVEESTDYNVQSDELDLFGIYASWDSSKGFVETVMVEGQPLSMEIDTGAVVSVASDTFYKEHLQHLPLKTSSRQLRSYSGDKIELLGEVSVHVEYEAQKFEFPLTIVRGNKPALMGRNWLTYLKLDWPRLTAGASSRNVLNDDPGELLQTESSGEILDKHQKLFENSVGKLNSFKAHVYLKENAKPTITKARSIPYAMNDAFNKELDRLVKDGILEPVDHSEWASPVVVVPKRDKTVRVCGDYKVHVNPQLMDDGYPLPNVEDLLTQLAGGAVFSKLDLSHAYQQLELDDESQVFLTLNTPRGLFKVKRLMYGIASAPAIFQKTMDQILQGIDGVICYLDDILIRGRSEVEHDRILDQVLTRLESHGVRLKRSKCEIGLPSVTYLGFRVDKNGLHPTDEKTKAISEAPSPKDVSELRSWLGLVNYYGSFLDNLSTKLEPLYSLLKQDTPWNWSAECQAAFDECKRQLQSTKVLVYYDLSKPIRLECDASPVGVGAVLSHVMEDGSQKPVAFASKTLTSSERNYAQIEREALAIVFGIKKFHKYLFGRSFVLVTDHKPLTSILGPKTGVPPMAAARMQRWSLLLSAYSYDIQYRRSEENANADAMSRLPCPDVEPVESELNQVSIVSDLPVTSTEVATATRKDPTLAKVLDFVCTGWPNNVRDDDVKPYFTRREELSTESGCILWGTRVVIPPSLRETLLQELHVEHLGISRTKTYARGYLWWPCLDADIESMISNCATCASLRNQPATAPLHPWQWPARVWQRVHIDFAEKDGQNYLVVIDSHSKWMEVIHMATSTTAQRTIDALRTLFAAYGFPEEIVSDNGPQFIAADFAQFLERNGVKHTRVPPYHPASNGAAERSVQILKKALASQGNETMSIAHRLAKFLLCYRNTPHTTTKCTPAELFLKRKPRNRLSLLKPNLAETVEKKQELQVSNKNSGKLREFTPSEFVQVRSHRPGKEKWIPGAVTKRLGPLTYLVRCGGLQRYVHVDHMVPGNEKQHFDNEPTVAIPTTLQIPTSVVTPKSVQSDVKVSETIVVSETTPTSPNIATTPKCSPRYPQRERKPVVKLNL